MFPIFSVLERFPKSALSFLFAFHAFISFSQTNLVPNSSFEIYDTCPNGASQIYRTIPWFQPTPGTSDYFNQCETTNYVSVPNNFAGMQIAKTGVAYAGFFLYYYDNNGPYREYMEVQLNSPLVVGTKYYVSFYVSLSDSSNFATDDMGAYFSVNSITSGTWDSLPYIPQISNLQGNYITDKTNWSFVKGEFIASGGEDYITIGNFKGDSLTDTLYVGGGWTLASLVNTTYYYIEDICVSTDSLTCGFPNSAFSNDLTFDIIFLPNPANDFLQINSSSQLYYNSSLKIYNILGEIVFTSDFYPGIIIQTTYFPDGFYFVNMDANTYLTNKKILIKH